MDNYAVFQFLCTIDNKALEEEEEEEKEEVVKTAWKTRSSVVKRLV